MDLGAKIIAFFAVAERIATVIALIQFFIMLSEQQKDPTNVQYVIDFFKLIPWFLIGQIPGMFISAILFAIFGRNSPKIFCL